MQVLSKSTYSLAARKRCVRSNQRFGRVSPALPWFSSQAIYSTPRADVTTPPTHTRARIYTHVHERTHTLPAVATISDPPRFILRSSPAPSVCSLSALNRIPHL